MVAARVMVGQTLDELRAEGLLPPSVIGRIPVLDHVSVKEAVLPFDRFPGVDTLLGPEMRSTGEVMGVDITFGLAFAKSQMAAGTRLPDSGTVFLSLADRDKPAGLEVARSFSELGFSVAATLGTAGYLRSQGVTVDTLVAKVGEEGVASDAVELIAQGKVQLVVNTPRGSVRGPTASTSARRPWPTRCPASPRWPRPGPRRRGSPTPVAIRSRCARSRTCTRVPAAARGERRPRRPLAPGLATRVGAVALPNPVMTASGTSGHGTELADYGASRDLGAVVVKSLSVEPGRATPRRGCTRSGRACSTASGCRVPGLAAWTRDELPALRPVGRRVVVSIWGRSVEDYRRAAEAVAAAAASRTGPASWRSR